MSAEEQTKILAAYIQARFPDEITEGGVGEVAVRILEKYLPDDPQPQVTAIPDENIVAEIRMPDTEGNTCLTFVLDRDGQAYCWPEFGDPVCVDPARLEAVAIAIAHLYSLCSPTGKTIEEIVHGR